VQKQVVQESALVIHCTRWAFLHVHAANKGYNCTQLRAIGSATPENKACTIVPGMQLPFVAMLCVVFIG
jgi:hypothetical protein